jgi:hypothetical protein
MKPRKVIVHLSGGLGNQMFQYMAGVALAQERGIELVVNLNWFSNPTFVKPPNLAYSSKRKADILQFKKVAETKLESLPTLRDGRMERAVSTLSQEMRNLLGILSENNYMSHESIGVVKTKRLFGFFMSPKFFLNVDPKNVFKEICNPQTSWLNDLQELLGTHVSIGVHIRLGDYVTLGDIVIPHEDYYLKGIEYLQTKLGAKSRVFLFTDQPEMISKFFPRLSIQGTTIFAPSDTTSVESLIALSRCAAFVCSNSTFSWWGAALSSAQGELIVRPSYFYSALPEEDSHVDLWGSDKVRLHPVSGIEIL